MTELIPYFSVTFVQLIYAEKILIANYHPCPSIMWHC